MRRRCGGESKVNYLLLLLVIAAGVAIGNLAADWIGAQLVAYRADQALAELSESAAAGAGRAADAALAQAQKAAAAVGVSHEAAREARRRDREGQRLFRACDEWRTAHAQPRTPRCRSTAGSTSATSSTDCCRGSDSIGAAGASNAYVACTRRPQGVTTLYNVLHLPRPAAGNLRSTRTRRRVA